MENNERNDFPFLTRDMLAFGEQTAFALRVGVNCRTNEVVLVHGFTKEGPFTFRIEHTGDESTANFTLAIPDLTIVVSATVEDVTANAGPCFVIVSLLIDSNRSSVLAQGLITFNSSIAWPNSPNASKPQLTGKVEDVLGLNPAAGDEVADSVPSNEIWELLGISLFVVNSSTAADRTTQLIIKSPDRVLFERSDGTTRQASETHEITFIPGGTTGVITANELHEVALPQTRIIFPGGTTI